MTKSFLMFGLSALLVASSPVYGADEHQDTGVREVIETRRLNPENVELIGTETSMTTTVSFPSPIESLNGADFIPDPAQAAGNFNLSFTPGGAQLSVLPLKEGVRSNLNVTVGGEVYVLLFCEKRGTGVFSVKFTPKGKSPVTPKKRNLLVSPARLVGLLDKCKSYLLLAPEHPEVVDDLERVEANTSTDCGDFSIVLKAVYRKDEWDSDVFEVELVNKTDKEIAYNPEGWTARVNNFVYYQSVGDSNGMMAPKSRTPAWFAITGDQIGGTNDLDPHNRFTLAIETVTGTKGSKPEASSLVPLQPFIK